MKGCAAMIVGASSLMCVRCARETMQEASAKVRELVGNTQDQTDFRRNSGVAAVGWRQGQGQCMSDSVIMLVHTVLIIILVL